MVPSLFLFFLLSSFPPSSPPSLPPSLLMLLGSQCRALLTLGNKCSITDHNLTLSFKNLNLLLCILHLIKLFHFWPPQRDIAVRIKIKSIKYSGEHKSEPCCGLKTARGFSFLVCNGGSVVSDHSRFSFLKPKY